MRLCFFVQNHLGPEVPARLVRALGHGEGSRFVLVGHDEQAGHASAAEVAARLGVPAFPFAERARRGYWSLIAPYFQAIDWFAAHGVDYDWLVYLSGQDYPTQPLAAFEARLARESYDGYLRLWPAWGEGTPWERRRQGIVRYRMQYFDLHGVPALLLRGLHALNGAQRGVHFHLTYGPRVGLRWPRDPFRHGLACWAGKQWTILARAATERLSAAVASHPELLRWFARTVCPDEAVVQSLLVAAGGLRLCGDDLRYADFQSCHDGHPRLLDERDLPSLLDPRVFFARKFDPVGAPAVLDRLDQRILVA